MDEPTTLTYSREGRVARITLDRPERGNGITLEMPQELAACVERANLDPEAHVIRSGEVVVDEATYTAKIGGRPLDLTFKEFELLKFLAQHPGRVFSRQQLLQEVWGYDYFGGTRTVDVHVRRLCAKLGVENETLIGTVRNVGYRFVLPAKEKDSAADAARISGRQHA